MKIGLGFKNGSFFNYTSENTALSALARSWKKQQHDILLINRPNKMVDINGLGKEFLKQYSDLMPYVVSSNDARVDKLDMLWEMYDYRYANRYVTTKAKVKTGTLAWALSPLSPSHTKRICMCRSPLIITGYRSHMEALEMNLDSHLYTVGVDSNIFNMNDRLQNDDTTMFLWVGGCAPAAAPDIVLDAYFKEFTSEDNVSLTMVSPGNKAYYLANEMVEYFKNWQKLPKIHFVTGALLPKTMADIYRAHDVLVMPIRFHAGCHPVSEAMACGTLVITTPWTGPLDYAYDNDVIWIDCDLEPVREGMKRIKCYSSMAWFTKYFDGYDEDVTYMWARPIVDSVAREMRNVHEGNYDKTMTSRAFERSKSFSWDKVAENIVEAVENEY